MNNYNERDGYGNMLDKSYNHSQLQHHDLLLDKAQNHYDKGYALYRNQSYEASIYEYKKALWIREYVMGRYHDDTAFVYHQLGYAFFSTEDYSRALVALGTWLRIQRYLSGNANIPNISCFLIKKVLVAHGYSEEQIKLYDENLIGSLRCEKEGDTLRAKGEYLAAIEQYKRAIGVKRAKTKSGFAIGNNAATVSFCLRKIALLSTLSSNPEQSLYSIDWNRIDRIHANWDNNKEDIRARDPLPEQVLQAISDGDCHYIEFNHQQAIKDYQRAAKVGNVRSPSSKLKGGTGFPSSSIYDNKCEQHGQFLPSWDHMHRRRLDIAYNPANSYEGKNSNNSSNNRAQPEEDSYCNHNDFPHQGRLFAKSMDNFLVNDSLTRNDMGAPFHEILFEVRKLFEQNHVAAKERLMVERHFQSLLQFVKEMRLQSDQFQRNLLAQVKKIQSILSYQGSILKEFQISSPSLSKPDNGMVSLTPSTAISPACTVVIDEGTGAVGCAKNPPMKGIKHYLQDGKIDDVDTPPKRKRRLQD